MPTISVFFGFLVQMYWRDHNPAHVHVWYQGREALFAIESGEMIAGELPKAAIKLIEEWVLVRKFELLANWERARRHQPLNAVPGADVE